MNLVQRSESASESSRRTARSPIGWSMAIGGALVIAALALLAEYSGLDRWMLDAFFDAATGTFSPRRFGISLRWLHDAQSGLVGLFAVAAVWMTLVGARASSRFSAHEALYLLVCMALTTAAIGGIKRVSSAECPWDLQAYGGERPYAHLFTPAPGGDGRCAPGAHSSGAFSMIALFVLMKKRRYRGSGAVLLGVCVLGSIFALCQWMRGAHFPSHDLSSACIAWIVACALQGVAAPSPRRAALSQASAAASGLLPGIAIVLVLLLPDVAHAQPWPFISEIAFRGNDVTLPIVMRREIQLTEGDAADPAGLERDRQAIQDLGLFRKVEVLQEPLDAGVRVIYVVKEKWYGLVYPRLSASTDGQNALGAELRWNNVMGRNHNLRALVSSADNRDEGRGREQKIRASYRAPFAFDSPCTLEFSGSHSSTPIDEDGLVYDEAVDEFESIVSRKIGMEGAASKGWNIGGGIQWRREDASGDMAPTPWGDTYALVGRVGYSELSDHVFSETGRVFGARYEIADQNFGSDYSYTELVGDYKQSIAIGTRAHQTLEFRGELGAANNGPDGRSDYTLGGTNGLRGYTRNSFQGDFYYLFSAAYLRPLHWDWLRFVATVEAGNVYAEADEINTEIRTSFELGLRVRVPRLVEFEFEAGIAFPLDDGSGRIYGSRYGF